uniref:Uncharacterized protein n=1 Tax=Arundo donax TaxID=35708 RepID=A0A0A9D2G8_ARUDO
MQTWGKCHTSGRRKLLLLPQDVC